VIAGRKVTRIYTRDIAENTVVLHKYFDHPHSSNKENVRLQRTGVEQKIQSKGMGEGW